MNMQPNQPQTPPQKLVDFNLELEALCKKYQYEVRPELAYLPNGIVPQIKVYDKSPKDEAVALNQQPPEKPAEEPAAPADNPKVN